MPHRLPRVRPGDPISADTFNVLVDAINELLGLRADFPLVVSKAAGGIHLRLAREPRLRFVALDEDIDAGETDKPGHVLDYHAGDAKWVDTTTADGYSAQTVEAVTDPTDFGAYLAGERHVVYFDSESGKHIPLLHPGPHLAQSQGDIVRGAAGTVTLFSIDEDSETESALELTVHNRWLPRVWADAPAWVQFHPQSRRWYLSHAYSATLLLATVNEAGGVEATDGTFDVDGVTPLNGHFGASTISGVRNTFGHILDDNATVALVWNDTDECWETWQGNCPE